METLQAFKVKLPRECKDHMEEYKGWHVRNSNKTLKANLGLESHEFSDS
jgi:hypothetical protein